MSLILPLINTKPKSSQPEVNYSIEKRINSLETLPLISTEETPTKTKQIQEPRSMPTKLIRKRGGWWDKVENKKEDMARVKEILRNQVITTSRPSSEEAMSNLGAQQMKLNIFHLKPLADEEEIINVTTRIAPAAEKASTKKNSNRNTQDKECEYSVAAAPKAENSAKRKQVRVPWNDDFASEGYMNIKNEFLEKGMPMKPSPSNNESNDVTNKLQSNEIYQLKKQCKSFNSTLQDVKSIIVTE
jgi:hypothetical protein